MRSTSCPKPCSPPHFDKSILAEGRCYAQEESEIEEEIDTEEDELTCKELEQREYLKKLRIMILDYISRYHTDPTQMLIEFVRGKYIIQPDNLSRLVVNNDLRIILPDFDEIEVTLYPLAKAIYFLFLLHPEGIVLKRIDKYRDELTMIYDLIMPNRNDDYSKSCLNNIFDPLSGSLTQNISRIKRSFKLKILNEKIASNYYITGIRGTRYGIALDREKVQMPQVLL